MIPDLYQFIKSAEELQQWSVYPAKPCVVIMGSFNSGKSTLINHLLEEEISPVGIVPTTSCLMQFDYGPCFRARYTAFQEQRLFTRRDKFHAFLGQKKLSGGRVEIALPSSLLKKCHLVDTPGVDFLGNELDPYIKKVLNMADKIVYLFHQRGIGEHSRQFLYKLKSHWGKKETKSISFWLNCNIGNCDGTALVTTHRTLKEIFLTSEVKLNVINSHAPEDMKTMRLFLEVELARDTFRGAYRILKEMDGRLPARLKKAAGMKDECQFLHEVWEAQEAAVRILKAGKFLHSLPLVLKEMEYHLQFMSSSNRRSFSNQTGGKPYRPRAVGIKENREALLRCIDRLLNEEKIKPYLNLQKLRGLYRQIKNERFTVLAAGGFSTGKSTFMNALLKEALLPTANGPTTASVIQISHGDQKTACIHFPLQSTLYMYQSFGDKAVLCREEITTLEKWLSPANSEVAFIEAHLAGRFVQVEKNQVHLLLNRVKELFAAGSINRAGLISPMPSVYKPVSLSKLTGRKIPQQVRVTFKNSNVRKYDLSDPVEITNFWHESGPNNAFKIEDIKITHPCQFLQLADFIDTPGMDWIHKHSYERTTRLAGESDTCLFFLNAKHLLNDMDRQNLQEIFQAVAAGAFGQKAAAVKEIEKYLFVINFSDTLNMVQRETAFNFVRKNLLLPGPRIFFISALRALAGEDGGMTTLLKSLESNILRCRGKEFYLSRVDDLYSFLDLASREITEKILPDTSFYLRKKHLREVQETLRSYKRELKSMKTNIFLSKPP